MSRKAKVVGLVVGLGTMLAATIAMAATGKKKDKPLESDESPEDIPSAGDDVTVVLPTNPEIEIAIEPAQIIPDEESVVEEVLPDVEIEDIVSSNIPDVPNPTNSLDSEAKEIAAEEGVEEKEVVSELVSEITAGSDVAPLAPVETSPSLDPVGTVSLARLLLAREELPGWKDDLKEEVKNWQENTKGDLVVDGKFGIKSAARMALEVGILPLVRYYPTDTYTSKQATGRYREEVGKSVDYLKETSLPDAQPQIDALYMSMARESGQSFGVVNPKPQPTRQFVEKVISEIGKLAEMEAEKELS